MIPVELSRAIVTAGYLVIVAAGIAAELIARRRPDGLAPLGDMLDTVMDDRTIRVAVIAAWWWFGWHFLIAPTVPFEL